MNTPYKSEEYDENTVIDNGVMFQDKHGIRYYNKEPDSDDDEIKLRPVKRSESNGGLDCSLLFFEGFNEIEADDKVTYM